MNTAPVLVTGGFGAIGAFVVRRLIAAGHQVIVYSRTETYALLPDLEPAIEYAAGDVQDRARLLDVLRATGARRVIHLAAALGGAVERDPPTGYRVNVLGSLNLFDAARDLELERVVFASSKAAYGALRGEYAAPTFAPVTEDYVGQTSSVYGATKKALEDAAHHYRRLFGADLIALRLGSTYGPGKGRGNHAGYSGLKARIVDCALRGEPFAVPSPDLADDIVYNGDVAKAAVLACFAPPTEHWQFNVANEQLVSLRDFATAVMAVVPEHHLTLDDSATISTGNNVVGRLSIARARAELGFEPDFPGLDGAAEYARATRLLAQRSAPSEVR